MPRVLVGPGRLRGSRARRVPLLALCGLIVTGCLGVLLPASVGADATVGSPPTFSSITGLPDDRIYELVSPANKHGQEIVLGTAEGAALAGADGNAVMYLGTGGLGERSVSGDYGALYVSERRPALGWTTRAATPRPAEGPPSAPEENNGFFNTRMGVLLPSADLSHLGFASTVGFNEGPGAIPHAFAPPPDRNGLYNNFYLQGPDPLVEAPQWVAAPQIENAPEAGVLIPAGGSPDLSTLYFTATGPLLPEDQGRQGNGLYVFRDGVLSEAGVLPSGSISPLGALPAAMPHAASGASAVPNPDQIDNQVSEDGTRAFFISPDPTVSSPTELYVRVMAPDGTGRTVLVSRSQMPGHVGEAAPAGAAAFTGTAPGPASAGEFYPGSENYPSYVYASSDGSHAFFQSTDQLTASAPADSSVKTYDFDVDTGALEYMPGVVGSPVASAHDGSSLLFLNNSSAPAVLERWATAPGGGSVTPIVALPRPGGLGVGPVRISGDGQVAVFETNASIAGFNDGGRGQIFRYDSGSNELSCISCPPTGVAPKGDAFLSFMDKYMDHATPGIQDTGAANRGMSEDGSRVFFDTPDPLVSQDVNGRRDVYEWENGTVFLVSSGSSSEDSYFLDSSVSGGDVFFVTSSGLVSGDVDGSYDVYDARIPHPGDGSPPSSVPCEGDVCQGPPSVPNLLGSPASATFNGLGNVTPESAPASRSPSVRRAPNAGHRLAAARRACRKKPARSRAKCEAQIKRAAKAGRSAKATGSTKMSRRGK